MFGSIDIKTRPLKIAYLVDPNNAKQTREAIRISSTLWGGDYFPIIPLYKRMPSTWREKLIKTPSAKSVILGYVEAFDPDIFIQFSKEAPKFINDIGIEIVKPDEVWSVLNEDRNLSPKYGLGIFELLNNIFEKNFKFKMKYPIEIIFPKIPKQYSLFWASWFGELPSKVVPQLEKYYFEPLEIKTSDLKLEDIQHLMSDRTLFPRRITHHEIESYGGGFRRDSYVYFLDVTKVEDIVDFWNLRAIGRTVLPLPKQLKDDPNIKKIIINFLKANQRPWPHNPKVFDYASIVRSRNSTMEEIQEYTKTLKNDLGADDSSAEPYFCLQHWYPRVWDEWARDKDGAVPSNIYGEEEESIEITDSQEFRIGFKSLLPKFAQKYSYHGEPRCANEISFRFYGENEYIAEVFPKSSGENFIRTISGLTSFRGDWRVGRNGLVKLVKDNYSETREVPLAENVFFSWLKDLGWNVKLSSAGLLAKQIYRKIDGFVSVLTNEKFLGLLEHMNGGSVKQDGSPVTDNKITQERDLSVGEVKTRLNDVRKNNLHDYLVEKGVFKIGLRLQCPYCLRNSWFALDDVREKFICPRCLNAFPAIGNIDSSAWYYKTAGPFSVPNYADGAYSVLLTADFLNDRKMTTLRITPVLSFIAEAPGKISIEADLAAFWQESIYGEKRDGILFCECKTYGIFQKRDFDRMRYFAKTFPGAVLIFSTLRKTLSKKEITGITKIAKAGRKYWKAERPINPVLILTGNELLSHFGPPYCWEDSIKKKFDRVHGLIALSDVTQQLYLNLSSWQTEWHEKWEKRHQRRRAKMK
jgi:hypothetical protein